MELLSWVLAFKSLALSSAVTISQNGSNLFYIAAYSLAISAIGTRQLRLSFLCLVACIVTSNSIIYDLVNGWQLHIVYSIIYLIAVPYMDKLKVMAAVFLMASFNCLMAWDAYRYAEVETFLFIHYESITAFLHIVVIATGVDWRRIVTIVDGAVNRLLLICRHSSSVLHIRYLLRYNKEEENHRKY